MSSLAERLHEALTLSGKSQSELARACGLRAPSVHSWFSGRTQSLKGESLLRASSFLGVNDMWLASGKGPMARGQADLSSYFDEDGGWPFKGVSRTEYDRLTVADKRDLDRLVSRFIAGCLAQETSNRSAT